MTRRAASVDLRSLAAVALGGGLGAAARYLLVVGVASPTPPAFPVVTLGINVVGSFLLGLVLVLSLEVWPPTRYARPFLAIGVLGGFTTFSTFAVETDRLLTTGHAVAAAVYVGLTWVFGVLACVGGSQLALVVAGRGRSSARRRTER